MFVEADEGEGLGEGFVAVEAVDAGAWIDRGRAIWIWTLAGLEFGECGLGILVAHAEVYI